MTQTQTANERWNLRLRFRQTRTGASVLEVEARIPSQINAISPLVDRLMRLIEGSHCVTGEESVVELALREVELALGEALNNAVVHGNGRDARKLVHVRCRCELGRGVSLIVSDQGKGFDPDALPNPLSVENLEAVHGRGIHFIKSVMDEVSFARGGTEVRMWKAPARHPGTELRRSSQGL